jgi:hypothetical protein
LSRTKKIIIAVLALVIIASAGGYAWWSRRSTAPIVTVESIRARDLEAIRLGVGQNPAQAIRQHQRGHLRARGRSRGQRGRFA